MALKWKSEYSVGIQEIDNQHKKLFEIGNRLFDLASLKDEYDHYDEIVAILRELNDYTEYHFAYEEKQMEQYGYEAEDFHKIEHVFFIKKLRKLDALDHDEMQSESIIKLVEFVADWITAHILQTDMKYREFFHNKGLA